jgi:hypothetical protein
VINLDTMVASAQISGRRQLHPNDPALDVGPLVDRVIAAVQARSSGDPAVVWKDNGCVTIKSGVMIPKGNSPKKTLEGCRGRFRKQLVAAMKSAGWGELSPYVFERLKG